MIWRIEVRVSRTDAGQTTVDAVVETHDANAYLHLAKTGIAILRQAIDLALRQS